MDARAAARAGRALRRRDLRRRPAHARRRSSARDVLDGVPATVRRVGVFGERGCDEHRARRRQRRSSTSCSSTPIRRASASRAVATRLGREVWAVVRVDGALAAGRASRTLCDVGGRAAARRARCRACSAAPASRFHWAELASASPDDARAGRLVSRRRAHARRTSPRRSRRSHRTSSTSPPASNRRPGIKDHERMRALHRGSAANRSAST